MPCLSALGSHLGVVPELAEVEFYRSQWNPGLGEKVTRVHLHPEKRVFRGTDLEVLAHLEGKRLESSQSSGKQMLFRFSGRFWVGIHLGMTGKLSVAPAGYVAAKHDHFVLYQRKRALVFADMRQFGRVLVHHGQESPAWWSKIGPAIASAEFTAEKMSEFLQRRRRLPIKAALLVQEGFPGIGNWMADEILWRAGVPPRRLSGNLHVAERRKIWREARFVSREALKIIGKDFADPPKSWLIHERWSKKGLCPKHKTTLQRETIGGRTTAWCPKCQR